MTLPIPVAVGDIYQVDVHCHALDQGAINVYHFAILATAGAPTHVTLAGTLDILAAGTYPPCLSATASYEGVELRRIKPTKSRPVLASAPAVGSGGTPLMPRQVSGIWTKQSAGVGPGKRGRVYVPFPSSIDTNGLIDEPNATYLGNLATLATDWTGSEILTDGAGNTTTVQFGLLSRAGVFTPCDDFRINAKWATQRRRGKYGRPNPIFP
jgi:hypothetical protein